MILWRRQLLKTTTAFFDRVRTNVGSGGFRPGPGGTAPQFCSSPFSFVATHDFFAKKTQISNLFAFPNFRNMAKYAASIERPKAKSASASGGFAPDPLTRGPAS